MNSVSHPDMKIVNIDEALTVCGDRSFSMSKDLLVIDDVALADIGEVPLQLGFLLICFCTSGETRFMLNNRERVMRQGDLLISFGEQVFKDASMSADFHGMAVLMSRSYAQDCIVGLSYRWPYLLDVMENPVCPLSE